MRVKFTPLVRNTLAFLVLIVLAISGAPVPEIASRAEHRASTSLSFGMYAHERRAEVVSSRQVPERASRGSARVVKSVAKKSQPTVRKQLRPVTPPARVITSQTIWDRLAACETGGRWHYNGPSGYDGGLQFSPSTWRAMVSRYFKGFPPYAWMASKAQQIAVAVKTQALGGWRQWPGCARKLGLI